jgi:hypothetical protein
MAKFEFWEQELIHKVVIVEAKSEDEANARYADGKYSSERVTGAEWYDGGLVGMIEVDES